MIEETDIQEKAAAIAAVETLLYAIEDTLEEIQSRALTQAEDVTAELEAELLPTMERLYSFVDVNLPGDNEEGPFDWSPVQRIQQALEDGISEQGYEVATVANRATEALNTGINSLLPSSSEVFTAIVRVFGNLIDGLLGALSDNSDFWTAAATIFGNEIESHHDKVTNTVALIVQGLLRNLNERFTDDGEIKRRLASDYNEDSQHGPNTVEQYIAYLSNQPVIITHIVNAIMQFATIFEWLSARNTAFLQGVRQAALSQNPTSPLSVSQLIDMVRMRIIGEDFGRDHAKRTGYSGELFDLLRKADERLLDTQPILELWRRSGDDSVLDELYRLGYSQESVAALRNLALAVATPSDVVRFLVRDVFDPGAVQRGQLDEDFEAKYREDVFRAAGVSKELAQFYWRAHWQIPSPTQGYQMLHRKVMPVEELREMIKLADYAPAYVDKLIAISYLTPGRIDIRRMFETGILTTREELVHYHELLGYSPEHANVLADFVIRLKGISDEGKADRRFGRIATEIVRSFVVGNLSELQARDALTSLGFTEDRANLRLAEAEYARQRERADTIRDAIGRRYVRGYLTEEATRSLLKGYAFDEAEANYLLDGWNIQLELREETDTERQQKDLSKSEILSAYDGGLLSPEATKDALTALGYDDTESTLLIQLADAKEARADAKATESSARTQFLNRRITASETRAILEGIGYTQTKVASLLSRWIVEQEERRPDVSPAQLERMLMQGVIPMEQVEERLRQRGYTEEDISALLTLYGTDVSIAEEKLREQQRQFEIREARLREHGGRRLELTERGQDLGQERFTTAQRGLQQRFEQGIEARQTLQEERLSAQRALQSDRIAAQTDRDAAALAASRERQLTNLDAAMQRLETQIAAADRRAEGAARARSEANALRERLAGEARAAADARQASNLQAQADRQQRNIDAANRRAEEANRLRQGLQDQREVFQAEMAQLRDELQQLRDIRQEAARVRQLGRTEQVRIRQEQRTAARRDISTADAMALLAETSAVALQKSAAIAEVEARFAALQARISESRQSVAQQRRQDAERALAAATPASALLETFP